MARLILSAAGSERTVELKPGSALVVGRDPACDVSLPDGLGASRRHCEIRPAGQGWEVADLGATNKTRVNGSPVDRRALGAGDVIEVGKATLKFEDPDEEERLKAAGRQGVCLLEWSEGPKKGERVLLSAPRTTLGRRPGNTVVLDDKMASGHHAEIVKDLNGYTIRDLGSTNGIMVNGQPTTEAPLSHGARVRVGSSRFVFRDPSMKDVEVELARLEEDDGWGMMGEIDLSRARVSKSGTIAMLSVLGLAGAGGWYIWQEGEKAGRGGPRADVGERITNGSFESADMPWSWPEGGTLTVARAGGALVASNEAGADSRPESVVYEDEFSAAGGRTLTVKAKLRGEGELLAVWANTADRATGATGVVRAQMLASGSSGSVARELAFPSWATSMRLTLRVPPGGRATLDDVSLRASAEVPSTMMCDCDGLPHARIELDGSATIATEQTPLVVGLVPIAVKGGERYVFRATSHTAGDKTDEAGGEFVGPAGTFPGSVTWKAVEDGLGAMIQAPGAERVGLAGDLPRAHLGSGLNVLTGSDAMLVPLVAGQQAPEVRKTLAGNNKPDGKRPPTLLAFLPAEGVAALRVEDAGDASMVRLAHEVPGAAGTLKVMTDFSGEAQAAAQALAAAKALVKSQPIAAVGALRQVAEEFRFEGGVAAEASTLAKQLEDRASKEIGELKTAMQAFRLLGSPGALAEMNRRADALSASFLGGGAAPTPGSMEAQVADLARRSAELGRTHEFERLAPQVERRERLGEGLALLPGYEAMAALIYRSLGERLSALLGPAAESDERVQRIAQRRAALEQRPEVKAALPPR